MLVEVHTEATRRAVAARVRIAMGTDAGVTRHGENLTELSLLVDAGMNPAEALHSATMSAARLLGLYPELGSITPGKRADLVIVEGDPLDVGTLAQRVLTLYQDGRLVADHRERAGVAA